ncbi:hypothetical protein BJ138DRAFT_1123787 [Hygrophoropsis aurantiaca]|uniref:Uncharacterized protein n=1 Tax=Hygrophoropsis aurantiaca TaxID=72124 RepID=A0ACB8AMH8_9AGAM|nr:hypothetical protein BJ138DRAFT_1123787 [Hygrophoropsis aurantiaca]
MSSIPPSAAVGSSAEAQAAIFAADPRIHFSKESGTWRLEEEDGSELEYDSAKGKWVPLVDEDLVKKQQAAYSVAGVDEEAPAAPVLARANKKRKEPEDYTSATPIAGPSTKRGKNADKPPRSKNTAVYVTGLPLDAELDEIAECFGKFGVIEEDDEGELKIKLYANDNGQFTGEALVVYFKEESVPLAVTLLDESELRIGDASSVMRVQKAEFNHKNTGMEVDGQPKPRKTVDKKKASRRIGKMQKKLLEWDDEDGFGPAKSPEDDKNIINRNSRVVVLMHMFSSKDLDDDPTLLLDLKEDVRDEAASLGEVTNVVLYDASNFLLPFVDVIKGYLQKEPDGIMTVKFKDHLSAQACVLKMNGRFFDGRRIEASLYAGKQRFRRSGAGDEAEGDDDAAEKRRLDDFASWLMTEGD